MTTATRTRRVGADRPDLLEALLTAAGPHLEPVLDVGTTAGGDLLLVVPEPAARLTDLLLGPAITSAGEAVTVLAPLAESLGRLHAHGVALGGVHGSAVVLDADGSPAWSPDRAVLSRRAGPAAFSAAVEDDLAGFAALADGLLARCGCDVRTAGRPLDDLVEDLFDLADPLPVRLRAEVADVHGSGVPGRLLAAAGPDEEPVSASASASWLAPLAAVRRRVWIAFGAVAVLLVAALVLLPSGGPGGAAGAGTADGGPARSASHPVRSVTSPARSASPAPVAPLGTAPREAVRVLLATRARCLAAEDVHCLERVSGAGSPIRAADRAAVEAGTEAPAPDPADVRMVSATGGTAIAEAARTMVVAVREPDGWRLRDVVAEPPG